MTPQQPTCLATLLAAIGLVCCGSPTSADKPAVGKSADTALGKLAARMKAGTWAELKTKNADVLHYGKETLETLGDRETLETAETLGIVYSETLGTVYAVKLWGQFT